MNNSNSNLTVNWKGKDGKRGLSETALELMQKILNTKEKKGFVDLSHQYDELNKDYLNLTNPNIVDGEHKYTFAKELKIVEKYCRVLI